VREEIHYFIRVKLIPESIKPLYWDEVNFERITDEDFIGVEVVTDSDLVYVPKSHYVGGCGSFWLEDLPMEWVFTREGKNILIDAV